VKELRKAGAESLESGASRALKRPSSPETHAARMPSRQAGVRPAAASNSPPQRRPRAWKKGTVMHSRYRQAGEKGTKGHATTNILHRAGHGSAVQTEEGSGTPPSACLRASNRAPSFKRRLLEAERRSARRANRKTTKYHTVMEKTKGEGSTERCVESQGPRSNKHAPNQTLAGTPARTTPTVQRRNIPVPREQ
jgi:hypothetical protein